MSLDGSHRPNRRRRTAEVVFQPATHNGMQRGIDRIANAIRPTLGPRPRIVAIDRIQASADERMPELLDDGGTIAKRIIQLADRDADVGAMFLREVLWRLHDQVGDGTATTAVLFQAIYSGGIHYLASGGNSMRLRTFLEAGMWRILETLDDVTLQVSGQDKLAEIAESICFDPELAAMLGEIFDIIGEFGRLEVREGRGRGLEREYVEGMYWDRGLVSREMVIDAHRQRADLENAAILITDLEIGEPRDLFPVLELALRAEIPALMIVARKVSERAVGFLVTNKQPERFQVIAVTTPGWSQESQAAALEDLAILTGGRAFIAAAGDTLQHVRISDLGRARRVWADHEHFGVVGGQGDARGLRRHIRDLRRAYEVAAHERSPSRTGGKPAVRKNLSERIGKLMGGSATLWVGGATEVEIKQRKAVAERTAAAVRLAMMDGVVPGGGAGLLASQAVLEEMLHGITDPDERAAYRILMHAVAEPMRTIVSNAGFDPGTAMARINVSGAGFGFDVQASADEQVVDMVEAGIYDATAVQKSAVFAAVSSAALALTIDVVVHHREPEKATRPKPSARKQF